MAVAVVPAAVWVWGAVTTGAAGAVAFYNRSRLANMGATLFADARPKNDPDELVKAAQKSVNESKQQFEDAKQKHADHVAETNVKHEREKHKLQEALEKSFNQKLEEERRLSQRNHERRRKAHEDDLKQETAARKQSEKEVLERFAEAQKRQEQEAEKRIAEAQAESRMQFEKSMKEQLEILNETAKEQIRKQEEEAQKRMEELNAKLMEERATLVERMEDAQNYPWPDWLMKHKRDINIAVTGASGSGKSSFVNAVRNVKHQDVWAARVGEVETTKKPARYPFPGTVRVLSAIDAESGPQEGDKVIVKCGHAANAADAPGSAANPISKTIGHVAAAIGCFIDSVKEEDDREQVATVISTSEDTCLVEIVASGERKHVKVSNLEGFVPDVNMWDLPGCGTKEFPQATYLSGMGIRHFDVVVVMTSTRFTEGELKLVQELTKYQVPFLLVRNKIDEAIDGALDREDEGDFSDEAKLQMEHRVINQIKKYFHEEIDEVRDKEVYCISTRMKNRQKYDYQYFQSDMRKSLQDARGVAILKEETMPAAEREKELRQMRFKQRVAVKKIQRALRRRWKAEAAWQRVAGKLRAAKLEEASRGSGNPERGSGNPEFKKLVATLDKAVEVLSTPYEHGVSNDDAKNVWQAFKDVADSVSLEAADKLKLDEALNQLGYRAGLMPVLKVNWLRRVLHDQAVSPIIKALKDIIKRVVEAPLPDSH